MQLLVTFALFFTVISRIRSEDQYSLSDNTKVLDLTKFDDENPPPAPVFIDTKKTFSAKSFCIRYYLVSIQNQGIFTTQNGNIGLVIYTVQNLGFIELHNKHFIFPLPKKKPYEYEHFCFSRNDTNYLIASEGNLVHSARFHKLNISEIEKEITDTHIMIGPTSYQSNSVKYFMGKISELNIFSKSFSESELVEMTASCDKIDSPGEKVFDWSKIESVDFTLPNGYSIEVESDKIQDTCSTKQRNQIAILPFPITINGNYIVSLVRLKYSWIIEFNI